MKISTSIDSTNRITSEHENFLTLFTLFLCPLDFSNSGPYFFNVHLLWFLFLLLLIFGLLHNMFNLFPHGPHVLQARTRDGRGPEVNYFLRLDLRDNRLGVIGVEEGVFGLCLAILDTVNAGLQLLGDLLCLWDFDEVVDVVPTECSPAALYLGTDSFSHC